MFARRYNPDCTPGLIYAGDEEGGHNGLRVAGVRHTNKLINGEQ